MQVYCKGEKRHFKRTWKTSNSGRKRNLLLRSQITIFLNALIFLKTALKTTFSLSFRHFNFRRYFCRQLSVFNEKKWLTAGKNFFSDKRLFLKIGKNKDSGKLKSLREPWIDISKLFYISSCISPPGPGPPVPALPPLAEAITSSILRIMIAASVAALIAWVLIRRGSTTLFSNISSTFPV